MRYEVSISRLLSLGEGLSRYRFEIREVYPKGSWYLAFGGQPHCRGQSITRGGAISKARRAIKRHARSLENERVSL